LRRPCVTFRIYWTLKRIGALAGVDLPLALRLAALSVRIDAARQLHDARGVSELQALRDTLEKR